MQRRRITWVLIAGGCLVLGSASGGAHSIPTHENITKAAVAWLLKAQPNLQCSTDGAKALTDALLYGTKHEDDNYDDSNPAKMGRYMFHFLPAVDDELADIEIGTANIGGIRLVLHSVVLGPMRALGNCSSRRWGGFDSTGPGDVTCSFMSTRIYKDVPMTNQNTWGNAVRDAARSSNQYAGFSEGFVKLGYVMHLVEDQSSPAHAQNATHGHYAVKIDVSTIDPTLKGDVVDIGFSDEMEVDTIGNEARRDVPPGMWPPANPGQLIDKTPGEILDSMHQTTIAAGFRRESMAQRSARVFKLVAGSVEAKIEQIARELKLPWPLGNQTVTQELDELKRRVVASVREEIHKEATREMTQTMAKSEAAAREFDVLGPQAVRHAASLLWRYIRDAKPVMGGGAASCTVKP